MEESPEEYCQKLLESQKKFQDEPQQEFLEESRDKFLQPEGFPIRISAARSTSDIFHIGTRISWRRAGIFDFFKLRNSTDCLRLQLTNISKKNPAIPV